MKNVQLSCHVLYFLFLMSGINSDSLIQWLFWSSACKEGPVCFIIIFKFKMSASLYFKSSEGFSE